MFLTTLTGTTKTLVYQKSVFGLSTHIPVYFDLLKPVQC